MEECVGCVEKCGYTINAFFTEYEALEGDNEEGEEEKVREFMDAVSKLKVFKSSESPCDLVSKMSLTEYKPILKARIENEEAKNQFGNWRFTDRVSLLKKIQQNDVVDLNSEEKCTSADFKIMLGLKTIGEDIFDDCISSVDSKMLDGLVKSYENYRGVFKDYVKRGLITKKKVE
jgi:hypothetical protein